MSSCEGCHQPIMDGQWRVSDWIDGVWHVRHFACTDGAMRLMLTAVRQVSGPDLSKEWWEDTPGA